MRLKQNLEAFGQERHDLAPRQGFGLSPLCRVRDGNRVLHAARRVLRRDRYVGVQQQSNVCNSSSRERSGNNRARVSDRSHKL